MAVMDDKVRRRVGECLQRATAARKHAVESSDIDVKENFLSEEQRWLRMASSYRSANKLDAMLNRTLSGSGASSETEVS